MTKASRIGVSALGVAVVIAAVVVFAWWSRDANEEILSLLSRQRPAQWRLYRTAEPSTRVPDDEDLARAQVFALSVEDSQTRDRLQSLIDTARGRWPEAVTTLTRLNEVSGGNPELLNDLAIATIAHSPDHAINYFKGLQLLEQARKVDPSSPAPLFNTLQVYRSLGLGRVAAELQVEYERQEKNSAWLAELSVPAPSNSANLIADLRHAIEVGDEKAASELFERNLPYFRHEATEYALAPDDADGSASVAQYIATKLRTIHDDETLAAMLEPLRAPSRQSVLQARRHVRAGADAYLESKYAESYERYALAESALRGIDSPFDRAWIDLNRADTDIRAKQTARARDQLDRVVQESRKRQFKWLLGQALAAMGSNAQLTNDFLATESALEESIRILDSIGASEFTVRPLYYKALWRYIGGDSEGSLNTALRCLRLTKPEDHVRLTQVFWLMATSLRRLNYPGYAITLMKEAVREGEATKTPMMIAAATADLASVYQANSDYVEADKYLSRTMKLGEQLDAPLQRTLGFSLDVTCGRIQLGRNKPKEAAACLERNIENLEVDRQPLLYYLAPSLTLLAQAETMLGNIPRARELFQKAVDVVESDDDYLVTERSRLSFENERRSLYESAIAFEYGYDGRDAAWSYLQRYRSKLFLEFLGQTNPAVARVHSEAIRLPTVQKLIPQDVQVIEYFVLKDRLLIWLVSRDRLESFSVSVERDVLDRKVGNLVTGIRNRDDVSKSLAELYDLVIAPVELRLDPGKVVAIVPDLVLHRLPFGALRHAASGKYFIEKHAILESPNLTTLLAAGDSAPTRNFLFFHGPRNEGIAVESETQELNGLYRDRVNVKLNANKNEFLESLSRPSILHYAGHSVDAPDPLRSAILLDGEDGGPNSVTAADISRQRMKPNAVVILASCDSSVGNFRDGVGLRGLTSAFLIAGAGTVAGSLWPVEDSSTSSLMRAFHQSFARMTSAVEATRRAQMSFIEGNPRTAHPFYWSGFVVNGNLSALR